MALMRVTLGDFQGSTGGAGFLNSETRSGGLDGGATDGDVSMGVSSRIHTVLISRKICFPIPSQWREGL